MGISINAAETAARNHHTAASGSADASPRVAFNDRGVTEARAHLQQLSVRERLEMEAPAHTTRTETGKGKGKGKRNGKGKRVRARSVTTTGATVQGSGPAGVPTQRTRAPEAAAAPRPGGYTPSGAGVGLSEGVLTTVQSAPGTSRSGPTKQKVVWDQLPKAQNLQPTETAQFQGGAAPIDDQAALVRFVEQTEKQLERVNLLISKSRTQSMSDEEWRQLYFGLYETRILLAARATNLSAYSMLRGEAAGTGAVERSSRRELRQRLADVQARATAISYPWAGFNRRIETAVPSRPGERFTFDSCVAPGSVLRAHFETGNPSDGSIDRICETRYNRLPDLALTYLRNAKGRLLFGALQHGFVPLNELDGRRLARLSDAELKTLIADRLHRQCEPETPRETINRQVEEQFRAIRASDGEAAAFASDLKRNARMNIVAELAASALVADPASHYRALVGDCVPIDLFSIALLAPGDADPWRGQYECFTDYVDRPGQSVQVKLFDQSGRMRRARAAVTIRQFVFSSAEERFDLDPCFQLRHADAVQRLLGPIGEKRLGGEISEKHRDVRTLLHKLEDQAVNKELAMLKLRLTSGGTGPDEPAYMAELTKAQDDVEYFKRINRSLREIGRRLKTYWQKEDGWPVDAAARADAAALL